MIKKVFEGLKVADFTWWVAGPLTTKALTDYGATVVRIESAKRPGGLRMTMPYRENKPGINRSGFYAFYNANKYSLGLELNQPKGVEIAKKLIAWSDVVVENFVPGVMERWGLGYEDLKKIKPDIIMLRVSNQGRGGPFSKLGGLGIQLSALGGFTHFTGWPDRDPLSFMFAYSDYFVPMLSIPLLCAALDYRRRTGKGQMIDISQTEICFQFLAPYILEYEVNGKESERRGNLHPYAAPHNAYRCKGDDRWCAIAVFTDEEWEAFGKVIGNPAWAKDPKFATLLSRKKNEAELDRLVEEWTVNHTAEEVMKLMQEAGVAAGVAQKAEDIYNDPQLRQRNIFWKMNHKEIGEFTHMGQPSDLSKTPAEARMPAPCLGEHTDYVCKEILGLSEDEINNLLVEGIISIGQ
jgi:crotonobetainyl-CoA:carnitine CoA-transferase CaiB-like acyl-CoA transferase